MAWRWSYTLGVTRTDFVIPALATTLVNSYEPIILGSAVTSHWISAACPGRGGNLPVSPIGQPYIENECSLAELLGSAHGAREGLEVTWPAGDKQGLEVTWPAGDKQGLEVT